MTQQLDMRYVPHSALRPNPWNTNRITDPANEQKLRESMKLLGTYKPIVVRTLPDGTLEILGGEHRWKAAGQLGHAEVPIINVGLVDDHRAKQIGLVDNGRYGEDDSVALAALLRELGDEVLTIVPFSEADLAALTAAASVSMEDLDAMDRDSLPDLSDLKAGPTAQMLRFKVPIEDVAWVSEMVDKEMKAEGFKDEDSLSNAGHALISLLRKLRGR